MFSNKTFGSYICTPKVYRNDQCVVKVHSFYNSYGKNRVRVLLHVLSPLIISIYIRRISETFNAFFCENHILWDRIYQVLFPSTSLYSFLTCISSYLSDRFFITFLFSSSEIFMKNWRNSCPQCYNIFFAFQFGNDNFVSIVLMLLFVFK